MSDFTIHVTKQRDEYGGDEWGAVVTPPLNDGGPYQHWPSAAALLSAIAEDMDPEGYPDVR